jgi:hypothetical protein
MADLQLNSQLVDLLILCVITCEPCVDSEARCVSYLLPREAASHVEESGCIVLLSAALLLSRLLQVKKSSTNPQCACDHLTLTTMILPEAWKMNLFSTVEVEE